MTTTVVFLSLGLVITFLLLMATMLHVTRLQEQINLLDKENKTQNDDILNLMKSAIQHGEVLTQHSEVLKYLCEQDVTLGKMKLPYMGPIGQA